MLNDLATFTRLSAAGQIFGPALALGALTSMMRSDNLSLRPLAVAAVGIVLIVVWAVVVVIYVRRGEARLWSEVTVGSEEIVSGAVTPIRAHGRVVRRRIRAKYDAFLLRSARVSGPAIGCVATVVGAGEPRRVAFLVPARFGLEARKAPVVLAVHPTRPEVAVLDETVTRADLKAVAADPRFDGPDVPTDRSVAGGWLAVAAYAVGSAVVGGGLGHVLGRVLG